MNLVRMLLLVAIAIGAPSYLIYRMVVSYRTGVIWLRGVKAERAAEPTLYWIYFMTVFFLTAVMMWVAFQLATFVAI
jgi:hypothetical protein